MKGKSSANTRFSCLARMSKCAFLVSIVAHSLYYLSDGIDC